MLAVWTFILGVWTCIWVSVYLQDVTMAFAPPSLIDADDDDGSSKEGSQWEAQAHNMYIAFISILKVLF